MSPSRCACFRAALRARRIASAFSRVLPLGRFFIGFAALHLAKNALALHFLLQRPESLIDIVVANEYLQVFSNPALAVEIS
jgi:hypothetical protein